MADFRMPSLGADMTDGTVIRWLVKPGDRVGRGDIVVEVETDKADMEVEIFEAGIIEKLLVPEGERVPVGTPLATVATAVATPPSATQAPPPATPVTETPPVTGPAADAQPPVSPHHRATPTARILARELGLDLASVRGTGVDGAVTRQDVERASSQRAPAPAPRPEGRRLLVSPRARLLARDRGTELTTLTGTGPGGAITAGDVERASAQPGARPSEPPPAIASSSRLRASTRGPITALMERSNREIPHYYLGIDIDLSRALNWLKSENRQRPVTGRILYSALLLKATALAAHEVPEVNGYFIDGEFQPAAAVNLGVAISLRQGGLVAPAILDASTLPLSDLMQQLQGLVTRARAGRLRASEMSSGTITVTNLGEQGVDYVHGVIYPPQVALVGFGKIIEKPWAEAGMLGVRPVITATLAADHRASDGHRGGKFLATIAKLLQEPEHL